MTLAAFANVGARATDYKDSGAFPDARMDQLRALAYLDLLNGVTPADRITRAIARARAEADARAAADPDGDPGPDDPNDPDDPNSPDDPRSPAGPGGGQPGGPSPSSSPAPDPGPGPGSARPPALQNLIIPLRTLLGLAARPGEGHNLGPLDPGLARALAAASALSPRSEWCVTIVDPGGIAIGHGCARAATGTGPDGHPGLRPRPWPGSLPGST